MKYISLLIHIAIIVLLAFIVATFPTDAFAAKAGTPSAEAGASGIPIQRSFSGVVVDTRAERLELYLASHNSPLAVYAPIFIDNADKYGLDWRLVPAISGVESTFGKFLPANSYNAYGWNGGNFYFKSWEDGIEVVSRILREKYINKWNADTPAKMSRYYAPPSQTWARNVAFFMDQIEKGPKNRPATLDLKLTI